MTFCFFSFCFWVDWGRRHHSSLSVPHTLQGTASAPKVALRFRHLWFICLICKFWISGVSVFLIQAVLVVTLVFGAEFELLCSVGNTS